MVQTKKLRLWGGETGFLHEDIEIFEKLFKNDAA